MVFLFYSAQPNYTVDITAVVEQKARAAAAHSASSVRLVDRYDKAVITDAQRGALARAAQGRTAKDDGRYVERFRRSEAY